MFLNRDLFRIMSVKYSVFLSTLFLATTLVAEDSVFEYAKINFPFEIEVEAPWSKIIQTEEEWIEFYEQSIPSYVSADSELRTPPQFNFELYFLVAGGLDSSYSASEISIEHIRGAGSITYISAAITTPGDGCNSTSVVRYPNIVILVPKLENSVSIGAREFFYPCE